MLPCVSKQCISAYHLQSDIKSAIASHVAEEELRAAAAAAAKRAPANLTTIFDDGAHSLSCQEALWSSAGFMRQSWRQSLASNILACLQGLPAAREPHLPMMQMRMRPVDLRSQPDGHQLLPWTAVLL